MLHLVGLPTHRNMMHGTYSVKPDCVLHSYTIYEQRAKKKFNNLVTVKSISLHSHAL